MTDHPSPAELEGFVWNRLPAGRVRDIIAHLVRGCEQCRAAVAPHLAGLFGRAEPPEPILSPQENAAYDTVLDRAFAAALRGAREIREQLKREAFTLLGDFPLGELPELPPYLRGEPIVDALLERSWALRHENPEEMIRLAEWATVFAEKLQPQALQDRPLVDLQCRAWIELGNAYRVADDLAAADAALGEASLLFLKGSKDELLAARLFDVQASLYAARRRFDLAEMALDTVFAIHMRHGDSHSAGRALISKGIYLGYEGRSEEAITLIERGLEKVEKKRDPQLVLAAIQNQGRILVDCGKARDARTALFKLKGCVHDFGGRINELKIRWLEGQINAALGELDRAAVALLTVKQGFEECALGYKAALASLELGAVLLRRGNADTAIREVLEAADVFLALRIGREVRASVLLLRKSFEREEANLVLLEYVISQLRHSEEVPEGPFEPSEGA